MTARLALAATFLCGCAMASTRAPSMAPSTTAAPITTSATASGMREVPGSVSGAAMEPRPSFSVQRATQSTLNGTAPMLDIPTRHEDMVAEVTRLEAVIEHERATLATSLTECRSVCMAAQNICIAAQEICRIVGDANALNARDLRCRRAQAACVDAGRRRDGACPVCP